MSIHSTEKLQDDLRVLEHMAQEMDAYLLSDVLFWPMSGGNLPRLTLGGYLYREYRLLELAPKLLSQMDVLRIESAAETYNLALVEKIVRLETKAHEELEARFRQWNEYLRDIENNQSDGADYATAVTTRAMITALVNQLELPPYKLEPRMNQQMQLLDQYLRRFFVAGEFVWPEEWQSAYPQEDYWWLYGQIRR